MYTHMQGVLLPRLLLHVLLQPQAVYKLSLTVDPLELLQYNGKQVVNSAVDT